MLHRTKLVVMLALSYVAINQGAASFAPLLPTSSLLLTTTAATLLDTTTINESGNYYLGVDLSGPLVINASQVFLNMSGYTINGGITLTGAADTVAIYNGSVNGNSGVGISVSSGLRNILFSQLLLLDCSVGIQANGTLADPIRRIALDQVEIQGAALDGVDLTYCQELLVANSTLFGNGNYGLSLQNCSRGVIDGCSFINNIATGMAIDATDNIKLIENSSTSNGNYGYLFSSTASTITLNGCSASNNIFSGFFLQGQVSMIECTASSNSDSGFVIQTSQNSLLQSCKAMANGMCGFNDLASTNISYVSNLAHGNATDYCLNSADPGSGNAPYYYASITTGATGVSSWTNVQA